MAEVNPKVAIEIIPAFVDPTCNVAHLNEIRRQFPLSEPNVHEDSVEHIVVKHEDINIQSFDLNKKSEFSVLKCGMKSGNNDIDIKFEHLETDELDVKVENDRSFVEPTIKRSLQEENNLQMQMRTYTGKLPLKCNTCDYRCIWKSNLQRHVKIHTGKKPFKLISDKYCLWKDWFVIGEKRMCYECMIQCLGFLNVEPKVVKSHGFILTWTLLHSYVRNMYNWCNSCFRKTLFSVKRIEQCHGKLHHSWVSAEYFDNNSLVSDNSSRDSHVNYGSSSGSSIEVVSNSSDENKIHNVQ